MNEGVFTFPRPTPVFLPYGARPAFDFDDDQRAGFLSELEADPCPTVADVHGYADRQSVALSGEAAHWLLHMYEAIHDPRGAATPVTSRLAFDLEVQRAELARWGASGRMDLRAAQQRAGVR